MGGGEDKSGPGAHRNAHPVVQLHRPDKPIPGMSRLHVMEAIETLDSRRDLVGAGFVDIHAPPGEPTDTAAGLVVDPDAASIPDDFVLRAHTDHAPAVQALLAGSPLSSAVTVLKVDLDLGQFGCFGGCSNSGGNRELETEARPAMREMPLEGFDRPHDIPHGYSEDQHRTRAATIASPGCLVGTGRAMACHEHPPGDEAHCVGWLMNQLGPGNNIPLRLQVRDCENIGAVVLDGPQHECFEDTLPIPADEGG